MLNLRGKLQKGENVKVAVYDHGIQMNHLDLVDNIFNNGFDATTSTSPSVIRGEHGTPCAGIIGAKGDNNVGIIGVSPDVSLVSISIELEFSDTPVQLASGFDWALANNIDVISCSWGGYAPTAILSDAIENTIENGRNGKGTIIVFATGNYNNNVLYPANSNPKIIAVGAMSPCGERKNPNSCDNENWGSCYGTTLDIVAPGVFIPTTDLIGEEGYNPNLENNFSFLNYQEYFSSFNGTSSATPHVVGVAALILSVNPNLTAEEVSDIIEQTARKVGNYNYSNHSNRPNGTWNNEMGYGLVDAHKAVLKAIELSKTDLVIKDNSTDTGAEPNDVQYFWESPDIWIRNYNDSSNEHQNPIYKSNNLPNFIKVRVKNNGGVASTGYEKLKIYWAKASTALSYPNPWHGGIYQEGNTNLNALMGSPLDSIYIPILQPNEETILTVPWVVPNPYVYIPETNNQNDRWHFCLLARIEADNDPMYTTETTDLATNVRNNNNIAQKNVTVSQFSNFLYGGAIAVGNHFNISRTFNLVFKSIKTNDKYLSDEAEVHIELSDVVFNAWKNGGFQSEDVRLGRKPKTIVLMSENAKLKNLQFAPNKVGAIAVNIHFLTQAVSQESYTLLVKQTDENDKIVGGETFNISRSPRDLFYAQADDKEVNKNETVVLSAEDINETAIYNWYDSEGNLVHEGANFETSVDIAKTYKLEIIATIDGYKDYKDVEVSLKSDHIVTVYPNPLATHANISYKINNATNAYLSITGVYGSNVANNYILDINQNNITIDMSSYPAGIYTVSLIANGSVVDQMSIIKQ